MTDSTVTTALARTPDLTPTPPPIGRRGLLALLVLCVPTFLVTMDFSVLYLALPRLSVDLAPTGVQQLWIVDVYGLLIAGFLVTMGTVGDRIGPGPGSS